LQAAPGTEHLQGLQKALGVLDSLCQIPRSQHRGLISLVPKLLLGDPQDQCREAVEIEPIPGGIPSGVEFAATHRIDLAGDMYAFAPGMGRQSYKPSKDYFFHSERREESRF